MLEVISNKKLKKLLNPVFLTQEEYDEKIKEYTSVVKNFAPMANKDDEKVYNKAFMGSSKEQIKKIREITFAMCCDHLVDIYANFDMKKYNFEDMISNAYLFANDYAQKNTSYPCKVKAHKVLVEKAMEASLAKFIEKSNEIEIIPSCEVENYSNLVY